MKPILEIKGISKKFRLHHETRVYLNLRERLAELFAGNGGSDEDFWALRDVNFDVMPGDSIGIVGKNGAGKSTLLKILSKITPPSSGKIISRGRMASLLEVGTGFHPELTGRENIFLNGSILGMKRSEIYRNFDSIVDFSGVEKFLDTQLKHYSSGMQLRLAFSVAAFLENEILVIDEVLAVGDAEFQKRCLGKMEDISKNQGRTVLFVSHNMASLKTLCRTGLLLDQGSIAYCGPMRQTIETYLSQLNKTDHSGNIPRDSSSINTGKVKFTRFYIQDAQGHLTDTVNYLSDLQLNFEIEAKEDIPDPLLDVRVNTLDGIELAHAMNAYSGKTVGIRKGSNKIHCRLQNRLQPGRYSFTIGIHLDNGATLDYVESLFDFTVLNVTNDEKNDFMYNYKLGLVRFESEWAVETK